MTVGELRNKLLGVDDSLTVLIPVSDEFNGAFYSPCVEETGVKKMGTEYISEEEITEMQLLNKQIPEEDSFILTPCGFWEEKSNLHELN